MSSLALEYEINPGIVHLRVLVHVFRFYLKSRHLISLLYVLLHDKELIKSKTKVQWKSNVEFMVKSHRL